MNRRETIATLGTIVGAVVGWAFLVAQLAQKLQAPGIV